MMRLSAKILFLVLVLGTAVWHGRGQNKAIVDFEADLARPIKIGDSTVYSLVGNVVFHHNGAIIVCDSAIRFSDRYMECYNNVIINKDSTYIYGERADYNGNTNIANVYSALVKLIDKDVLMYSYDLDFNTLTSIARYTKGGTISQKDNLMESQKAEYHSEIREVFFLNEVAMKNDEYTIETDSMSYAFDPEITTFHREAKIWTKDGNFLSADKGRYIRPEDTYIFTSNSYVLTQDQQMWADSITYIKPTEVSYLNNNIQILDEKQNLLSFGDYAVYWGVEQDALLTLNPSIISFDPKQEADSIFTRADTIILRTIPIPPDSLATDTTAVDSLLADAPLVGASSLYNDTEHGLARGENPAAEALKELQPPVESGDVDQSAETTESIITTKPEERFAVPVPESPPAPPEAAVSPPKVPAQAKTKRQIRREERRLRNEKPATTDLETGAITVDSLPAVDSSALIISEKELVVPIDTAKRDTIQRIIRGFHNVKIFRNDFQAVCDSLVSFTIDSTSHMYINPVLWSDSSQVVSEIIHIFSKNEQLSQAEFEGSPIMSQQVADSLFNQVAGRAMFAYFVDNAIDRLDVEGNAQTYYFVRDDATGEIGSFLVAESANMTFQFDSSRISTITYREDVTYTMYPMDKIPDTQSMTMKGFKWEAERRPASRNEVFDRSIHPSRREESMEIPKPEFSITGKIELYKSQIIQEGIWRDRNDKLWLDASYFDQPVFQP